MSWLSVAKGGWRGGYDAAADAARFAAATAGADVALTGGFAGARPIFVVGMPRTGTTLVERILSSHSEVGSAGETMQFALALRRATGMPGRGSVIDARLIAEAMGADAAAIGRDYMRAIAATEGLTGRFVEKNRSMRCWCR